MSSLPALQIVVLGLWHLGSVTAACCARHFHTVGLDFQAELLSSLERGRAPVLEPGLNDLLAAGLAKKSLQFTTDAKFACANADVLWVTYDTPVNDQDESDSEFVLSRVRRALPHLQSGALVLISSQLAAGTCAQLEKEFPHLHFACSPENLRLGKAIDAFEKADRAVVGIRTDAKRALLEQLFKPFATQVLFMRTESAEMVKHALNSFLALSITFINEIARLCEHTGADAKEVSAGLKSDIRIGPKAYLGPGGPFAGGTLARDVVSLTKIAQANSETIDLIPAIKRSNDLHRGWAFRKLQSRLGDLRGKTIAVLGLVYTPNTDTLRRSAAVELCQQLLAAGARVQAFDPALKILPAELAAISLAGDLMSAVQHADAAAICTEWPLFRESDWTRLIPLLRQPLVIDANGFLERALSTVPHVELISVGRAAKI